MCRACATLCVCKGHTFKTTTFSSSRRVDQGVKQRARGSSVGQTETFYGGELVQQQRQMQQKVCSQSSSSKLAASERLPVSKGRSSVFDRSTLSATRRGAPPPAATSSSPVWWGRQPLPLCLRTPFVASSSKHR